MMRTCLLFSLILSSICLDTLCAQTKTGQNGLFDGVDYRWYWSPNAGVVIPDDDLRLNEANVFDVRVGKHLNEQWGMELELMRDEYDFDMDFDLKHYSATMNLIYTNHDPLWKPYFMVGLGGIYADARFPDTQRTDFIVNLAVGGSWYFVGNGARIRLEARSRLDTNNSKLPGQDGFGDAQFTIGLIIPIGD
ncbi:outer membrane beta-barrel protein [Marinicella gelatinilytica]|uniref:outer membrane beta-barrel protein n=1 Tax=Marinicella gelatinilytica TaxID=2996017 RepID=UPI002260B6CA|nr:outer membrane beta-barrel protein [Marinicella gelatinilytica]MCX7544112.1 outer membrane beta-barrel protein [Marinicella gelatinilytica]